MLLKGRNAVVYGAGGALGGAVSGRSPARVPRADALVGRQTRLHRDLDLAVDASKETVALHVLARRGYRLETDW
jgi:hypothetical protein